MSLLPSMSIHAVRHGCFHPDPLAAFDATDVDIERNGYDVQVCHDLWGLLASSCVDAESKLPPNCAGVKHLQAQVFLMR
jgi:hypothetical protein